MIEVESSRVEWSREEGGRERERERKRQRETVRHSERERERRRQREREKERDTERQTDSQPASQAAGRQADRQTDRETDREIDREIDRETDKETERQTETERGLSLLASVSCSDIVRFLVAPTTSVRITIACWKKATDNTTPMPKPFCSCMAAAALSGASGCIWGSAWASGPC